VRCVLPEELCADRAGLHDAARQGLVVHQRRRVAETVLLDEFACDTGRHTGAVRRDEEPHTGVTTTAHRSATRVHHETYQKTADTHHNKRYDTIRYIYVGSKADDMASLV